MSRHKHYDCIVAWAAGENIEFKNSDGLWVDVVGTPLWSERNEYRIKKEPVIQVSYFKLVTDTEFATLIYKEFIPDLEKWHLKITYQDGKVHSMPVQGYQAANQLASKYLEHGEVAVIVIRVTKDKE